jgi:hypothetical protein
MALTCYFVLVFVGIGGLQMYNVNAGFLTNYGADLFAPPYLYVMFRQGRLRPRPLVAFLTVFAGCALWEWAQRYDFSGTPLAITRGTFDPFDLVAYAAGLLACLIVDLRWFGSREGLPAGTF